jgi:spore maturation protein CgeB
MNEEIKSAAHEWKPQLTFHVQARFILPGTLLFTRRFGLNFVYMNDDLFNVRNQTFTFAEMVPLMDCILTTKSYNVSEFAAAGSSCATYIPNAYDPHVHYPAKPSAEETSRYSCDVGFIGTFRPGRADYLERIAHQAEYRLRVWGGGWMKMNRLIYLPRWRWAMLRACVVDKELFCDDMGKAIQSIKICLGLLNRGNRDLHTSRSFEIPACGGFMLAERTTEHQTYFEEDKEAVYFNSFEEMIDKIRFYLQHEQSRARIAEAGYNRCLRSDYRYIDRARETLAAYRNMALA